MSLDNIVNISISVENPIIDTASFGTPLIASIEANGKFSGMTKIYSSASELLSDGFSATGATYRFASKIKGQNPAPASFIVGKRVLSSALLSDYDFQIQTGNEADIYSIEFGGNEYSYTRPDGYTDAQVAAELAAVIDDGDYTVSVSDETISILSTVPGQFDSFSVSDNIYVTDNTSTVDGYLTQDLSNILEYDSSWYALLIDSNVKSDIIEAATFCEANRRMFAYETSDSACFDSGATDDVFSECEALSFANTIGIFSLDKNEGKAAAWVGKCLPFDPGTINWAHKVLSGVRADNLTISQKTAIRSKSGNYYSLVAGRGNTWSGITPSGEFIDTANVVHLLYARIQEAVISALKASPKIPYTNAGVARITSVIAAVLNSQVGRGLTDDPEPPSVTAPNVQSISLNQRQARNLPDVKFVALLSGAINSVSIRGTLTLDSSVFTA